MIKNIALILAGGIGTRIGAGIPKQFIKVLGKPILAYTLDVFQEDAHQPFSATFLAISESIVIEYLRKLSIDGFK